MEFYSAKVLEIALLIFLTKAAYEDYRRGSIDLIYLSAGGAAGLVLTLLTGKNLLHILSGAAVGAMVVLIAYASSESIGYGDGMMALVTGICLGWMENMILIFLSLFLSAICSVILMSFRLKGRKDRIPFLPFMLGGYILLLGIYR